MLYIKSNKGIPITNIDEWLELASPKGGSKQWKDFRSAKELARYVLKSNGKIPQVIDSALQCVAPLSDDMQGIPEYISKLPGKGMGRNHDLFIFNENLVIGIEAKADEAFGPLVKVWIPNPDSPKYSNRKYRIDKLCNILFDGEYSEDKYGELHYQLIQSLGSLLIEARSRGLHKVLFLTLVFDSTANDKDKMTYNDRAYNDFINKLAPDFLYPSNSLEFVGRKIIDNIETYIIKAKINIISCNNSIDLRSNQNMYNIVEKIPTASLLNDMANRGFVYDHAKSTTVFSEGNYQSIHPKYLLFFRNDLPANKVYDVKQKNSRHRNFSDTVNNMLDAGWTLEDEIMNSTEYYDEYTVYFIFSKPKND